MRGLIAYAGKERPAPRVGRFHGKTALMLDLWKQGLDTYDIAKRCCVSEAYAYKILAGTRERERGQ